MNSAGKLASANYEVPQKHSNWCDFAEPLFHQELARLTSQFRKRTSAADHRGGPGAHAEAKLLKRIPLCGIVGEIARNLLPSDRGRRKAPRRTEVRIRVCARMPLLNRTNPGNTSGQE